MVLHPDACNAIMNDVHVDDLLTGAKTICEAKTLIKNITDILKSALFNLRKWVANESRIVSEVRSELDDLKFLDSEQNT